MGMEGSVVVRLPLPPGNLPTLFKDDERYLSSYLSSFDGYFHVDVQVTLAGLGGSQGSSVTSWWRTPRRFSPWFAAVCKYLRMVAKASAPRML
jgi:hypothetical protein